MVERIKQIDAERLKLVRGGGVFAILFGGTVLVAGVYVFGGVLHIFPMDHSTPLSSSETLGVMAFAVFLAGTGGCLAFFRRWITIDLANRRLTRRYGFFSEELALSARVFVFENRPKVRVEHDVGDGDSGVAYHIYLRTNAAAEPILIYSATSVAERKRVFQTIWDFLKS